MITLTTSAERARPLEDWRTNIADMSECKCAVSFATPLAQRPPTGDTFRSTTSMTSCFTRKPWEAPSRKPFAITDARQEASHFYQLLAEASSMFRTLAAENDALRGADLPTRCGSSDFVGRSSLKVKISDANTAFLPSEESSSSGLDVDVPIMSHLSDGSTFDNITQANDASNQATQMMIETIGAPCPSAPCASSSKQCTEPQAELPPAYDDTLAGIILERCESSTKQSDVGGSPKSVTFSESILWKAEPEEQLDLAAVDDNQQFFTAQIVDGVTTSEASKESAQRRHRPAHQVAKELQLRNRTWLTRFIAARFAWLNSLQEPERTGCLSNFILSDYFGQLSMIIIMSHVALITYAANEEMVNPSNAPHYPRYLDRWFLGFYSFEICAKILVHRFFFFVNQDRYWNLFDLLLVIHGISDQVVMWMADEAGGKISFMRLVRLLKLGKVLRMFRALRFLRDLRVMVITIMGSAYALFWAFIMMFLIIFVFALLLVQTMGAYISESNLERDSEEHNKIKMFFGSVQVAALTLYESASGGVAWGEVFVILSRVGPFSCTMFIVFLVFFTFSVANIVAGIFLEQAMKAAEPDRTDQMLTKSKTDAAIAAEIERLFSLHDKDGSGTITYDEFTDLVNSEFVTYLELLGIEVKDAKFFFNLLADLSGTEEVYIHDIAWHCTKMKGVATGVDVQCLAYELKVVHRTIDEILDALERISPAVFGCGMVPNCPEKAFVPGPGTRASRASRIHTKGHPLSMSATMHFADQILAGSPRSSEI